MKKLLSIFFLISACATTHPPPPPEPVKIDTVYVRDTVVVAHVLQAAAVPLLSDYSPYFQNIIDSCIKNYIPVLYIPAGRFVCKEPLILSNFNGSSYSFFSLVLQGTSTFAGGFGTTLDFSFMTSGFGIGIQAGKGVEIKGVTMIGAFNYIFPGSYKFYNTALADFTDGKCRDSRYSPYAAIAIDPFGPAVPADGGFPGLSAYYHGTTSGSTGTIIEDCGFTNWVIGIITSPNGQTQNADIVLIDRVRFNNMKICITGCQAQEKMNRASNIEEWGVVHTCFATGLYGAGSIGNWYLDHWNIAGYTQAIIYNSQAGYFPSFFSDIFAESLGKIGFISTYNGTTFSNSTINFAAPAEAGSYTPDQISGFGVTFIGCQLRMYGTNLPVTILTGPGGNNMHFRDCSFETVPVYPQNNPGGYSDFQNCTAFDCFHILNPMAAQTFGAAYPFKGYAYNNGSNIAAKNVPLDNAAHRLIGPQTVIQTDSGTIGQAVVATKDYYTYTIAGIITAKSAGTITISYIPAAIDSTGNYYLFTWVTILK